MAAIAPPTAKPADAPAHARPHTASGVSIVLVSYNSAAYLERSLRALALEDQDGVEIIVVDNASPDGSADQIERAFPHVRVIRNESNSGFGHACNVGARHASGEYLVFLNPDTVVEPGWLDPLIATLERDANVGLATSRIVLLGNPGRINTCGGQIHCSGLTMCRGMGQYRRSFETTTSVASVSGAAFAIRRSLFRILGGFDDAFFMYQEDTDLSWRAHLLGYGTVCVAESVVRHEYTLRFGPRKVFYQERNRYLMLLKSLQWRTLLALLPVLILAEIVTWGFVLTRQPRQAVGKLAAYWWVASHWRQVAARRHATQLLRRVDDRALLALCGSRLEFEQTGSGLVAAAAHLLFDPLFLVLHRLALQTVRW
jgi:GT2 family glycosyltransferase